MLCLVPEEATPSQGTPCCADWVAGSCGSLRLVCPVSLGERISGLAWGGFVMEEGLQPGQAVGQKVLQEEIYLLPATSVVYMLLTV